MGIRVVQIVGDLVFGDKPDGSFHNVSSEDSEGCIWDQCLDCRVHAFLQTEGRIAVNVAVFTSWVAIIPRRICGSVGTTADILRTVVACANFIG